MKDFFTQKQWMFKRKFIYFSDWITEKNTIYMNAAWILSEWHGSPFHLVLLAASMMILEVLSMRLWISVSDISKLNHSEVRSLSLYTSRNSRLMLVTTVAQGVSSRVYSEENGALRLTFGVAPRTIHMVTHEFAWDVPKTLLFKSCKTCKHFAFLLTLSRCPF